MSAYAVKDEEWTRMRPHITRLYSDESRPLKDVVETLRQKYDFHAT